MSSVNLVELNDAARPFSTGAAPHAAKAEAAAWPRHYEPAALKRYTKAGAKHLCENDNEDKEEVQNHKLQSEICFPALTCVWRLETAAGVKRHAPKQPLV